jgi:hypothetical protein
MVATVVVVSVVVVSVVVRGEMTSVVVVVSGRM